MKQRSSKSSILRKAAVLVTTGCAAVLLAVASPAADSAAPTTGPSVTVRADTAPTGTPVVVISQGGGNTTQEWNSTGG